MKSLKSSAIARLLGCLFLSVALLGVIHGDRDFAKFRVGSLYILDILFLGWLLLAILGGGLSTWKNSLRSLIWPISFLTWGTLRLTLDLLSSPLSSLPVHRVLQHSLLFVYPVFWMTAGFWAKTFGARWLKLISYAAVAVSALYNLAWIPVNNFSTGPILLVPFVYCLHLAFSAERPRRFLSWAVAIILGVISMGPFWRMWYWSTQRTSLLNLTLIFFSVPFLINRFRNWKSEKRPSALRTIAVVWMIFTAGSLLTISAQNYIDVNGYPSWRNLFRHILMDSMQHGEDRPNPLETGLFQARVRLSMWKYAVHDWKEKPILGQGFVPEIPSYILPAFKNIGGYESSTSPPISGPHNSYLSILARTGIIGALIAFGMIGSILSSMLTYLKKSHAALPELVQSFFVLMGFLYAMFNVGMESPQHCVVLWFFSGVVMAGALEKPKLE